MGAEKQGSKSGGGYVGGLLQLFDWNAKSRKKLFSSKSHLPEQSKQKKRCDGNLPTTRLHLKNNLQIDEDEFITGSSIRGSSDYSCASSVIDEDIGGAKAPGVVARLMGLDSMPTSNFAEPHSSPYFCPQSLQGSNFRSKNFEGHREYELIQSGNIQNKMDGAVRNVMQPRLPKPLNRPIEKFQTEILPPKSAKSIPITHHKLLSPIKSANFIPSENAAHIMEAAARIIGLGPHADAKAKLPVVGTSSIPLKARDLKEKVETSQKPPNLGEVPRRPGEANALKYLKGQSLSKSWNSSADAMSSRVSFESEECSSSTKGKSKSISLALQAKANVLKREGLNPNSSRNLVVGHKEPSEVISSELFKSQTSTQNSTQRKPSTHSASGVLRHNNQKQNCLADREKLPFKPSVSNSQSRKAQNGDSSFTRNKSSSKTAVNSKVISRRSKSEVMNGKKEESCSTRNVPCKKRPIDGDFQFEKNHAPDTKLIGKNEKLNESSSLMDKQSSFAEADKRKGTDVVSFTFRAPMTRSFAHGSETFREMGEKNGVFSADNRGKRSMLTSGAMNAAKFSLSGKNMISGDALSTLLEQKLRELTQAVEISHHKTGIAGSSSSTFQDLEPGLDALSAETSLLDYGTQNQINTDDAVDESSSGFSSTDLHGFMIRHKYQAMDQSVDNSCRNNFDARKLLDCRLPSPVSVLEHSGFAESCDSSDTADSSLSGRSKQSSSVQAQTVLGTSCSKKPHSLEAEAELWDSASSVFTSKIEKQVITSSTTDANVSTQCELEYMKEILSSIELMWKDFALGRSCEIINPHLFDQLESRKWLLNRHEPKLRRKALFDCVRECLDIRCRQHESWGYRTWIKGVSMVRNKARLAEEVYKEISGWNKMGESMVDELVDKDMSSKHGSWLDFEIEAFELGVQIESRLLNVLLDEVIDDILVL